MKTRIVPHGELDEAALGPSSGFLRSTASRCGATRLSLCRTTGEVARGPLGHLLRPLPPPLAPTGDNTMTTPYDMYRDLEWVDEPPPKQTGRRGKQPTRSWAVLLTLMEADTDRHGQWARLPGFAFQVRAPSPIQHAVWVQQAVERHAPGRFEWCTRVEDGEPIAYVRYTGDPVVTFDDEDESGQ